EENKDLDECTNGATELESCGTAPSIKGIQQWLNTPDGEAIDLKDPARAGRPHRLLGVLLHQLPALHPARRGLG
ncbi:hypothetical protein AB1285_19090, partial [Microbacterium sp. NRRL B-14842]|uniref:hypothetical protein n=1 Tax=Microbacterium sp. NRRL B-14842 TaxID=3162881 RepID=UPI003D2ACD5A